MALVQCAAAGSAPHQRVLPRILSAGLLVGIQSLLSTRGDEVGPLRAHKTNCFVAAA